MKRISLLLILFISIGAKVSAHDIEVANDEGVTIYYNYINDKTELSVSFRGISEASYSNEYSGDVVIPSIVTYGGKTYNVRQIRSSAFEGCTSLTSVTIPDGVTSIGSSAFYGCTGLASVVIGNGVTSIGNNAFNGCSSLNKVIVSDIAAWCNITFGDNSSNPLYYVHHLYSDESTEITDLVIPEGVDDIGNNAFYGCTGLTSVIIPESVTSIGEGTFYNCNSLQSVNIPESVTSIGVNAFGGCNGLERVNITDLEAWCNISFGSVYANPLSKAHNLYLNGTKIDDLVTPSGISLLKSYAFSGGYFSSVTIPSGCLFTNSKCVFAFSQIGSITINQYLAEETFIQAQIGNLIIAPEVTGGGSHAFYDTKIDNLEIPYSSNTLGYSSFTSYALFDGCTINKATVNRITSHYGSNPMPPFYGGSIKELHLGSNTWYNGDNLCGLVTIDDLYFDGITAISANAFYSTRSGNNNIHNIHLSNEISSIGSYAFYSCGVLNNVYAEMTTPPEIDDYIFASRNYATLHVPAGCKAAYEAAQYWKDFNIVEMEPINVDIPEAIYYLKNVETGKYLNTGNAFGTHAILADEPLPARISKQQDGSYTIFFPLGSQYQQLLFRDGDGAWVDYDGQESGCPYWTITSAGEGTYHIQTLTTHETYGQSVMPGTYLGNNPNKEGNDNDVDGNIPDDEGMNITWQFIPEIPHTEAQATRLQELITQATTLNLNTDEAQALIDDENSTYTVVQLAINALQNLIIESVEKINIVKNSDLEGTDVSCFYSRENCTEDDTVLPATIVDGAGKDGSHGIVITSIDGPEYEWDTQFFLRLPQTLPAGTMYRVSFDYKASQEAFSSTQSQGEPSDYISSEGIGDVNYTTEWQHFENQGIITEGQSPADHLMRTIAFQLAEIQTATTYYLDNIVFEIDLQSYDITFADANVKAICVENWDTNDDGELSVAEAAAVTELGEVFKNNTQITSFDELQYFTGLTELPEWGSFDGCTALTSITIPANVTSIDGGSFANCASIEQISVDPANTKYESPADCNAIIEKTANKLVVGCGTIPDGITTIGGAAFWGRWGMQRMDIPETVTTIESNAFAYCVSLSTITLPASVNAIGNEAFSNCGNLTDVWCYAESIPNTNTDAFSNTPINGATLHVPAASVNAYSQTAPWSGFGNIYGEVSIAVNSLGKGTFCSEYPLDFTDISGIKAYIVSGFDPSAGNLIITRVYEVPAGTGLFIDGTPGTTFNIPVKETNFYYVNMMKGITVAKVIPTYEDGYTNFTLGSDGQGGVIFRRSGGNVKSPANRAYVQIPTTMAGARTRLGIETDDASTGIEGIQTNDTEDSEGDYYNLNGQKVQSLKKGIYIRNGKKIIIR